MAALQLDLQRHVAIGARGRDELPGVDADAGRRSARRASRPVVPRPAPLASLGGWSVQDEIEHVAQAGAGRHEGARVELRALERERHLRPALPAICAVAAQRGARQVADDVARLDAPVRDRQLRAHAERAVALGVERAAALPVAQPRKRTTLVPRRPKLPSKTGASGGPDTTPCSSPRLPPGMPRRSSSTSSLSCERASDRRRPLIGFAADIGLIDGEARARAALGRQQVAQAAAPVERCCRAGRRPRPRRRCGRDRASARRGSCRRRARRARRPCSSPVTSCGRPSCSNASARSESVAPAASALTLAFRSNAASLRSGLVSSSIAPLGVRRDAAARRAAARARRSAAGRSARRRCAACPSGRARRPSSV